MRDFRRSRAGGQPLITTVRTGVPSTRMPNLRVGFDWHARTHCVCRAKSSRARHRAREWRAYTCNESGHIRWRRVALTIGTETALVFSAGRPQWLPDTTGLAGGASASTDGQESRTGKRSGDRRKSHASIDTLKINDRDHSERATIKVMSGEGVERVFKVRGTRPEGAKTQEGTERRRLTTFAGQRTTDWNKALKAGHRDAAWMN